jgi:hypothetical protein
MARTLRIEITTQEEDGQGIELLEGLEHEIRAPEQSKPRIRLYS